MSNVIQFKRRTTGVAGAPASLKSGEPAYNMIDKVVYVGHGDDGSGNATSIEAVGGSGAVVMLTGAQTVAGKKTFSTVPAATADASSGNDLVRKSQMDAAIVAIGAGDMAKASYDTNDDGKVDAADAADAVPWTGVTGKPSTFTPSTHSHATSDVTGLDAALAAKAPLASPGLTGTPTAPTAAGGTNTTQIATTEFVKSAIDALIGGAPGALDTLAEIATALGEDADLATTISDGLATKLAKASNLADLNDAATARTNLGLGTMATQAASSVNITGGSIGSAVTFDGKIDGGSF